MRRPSTQLIVIAFVALFPISFLVLCPPQVGERYGLIGTRRTMFSMVVTYAGSILLSGFATYKVVSLFRHGGAFVYGRRRKSRLTVGRGEWHWLGTTRFGPDEALLVTGKCSASTSQLLQVRLCLSSARTEKYAEKRIKVEESFEIAWTAEDLHDVILAPKGTGTYLFGMRFDSEEPSNADFQIKWVLTNRRNT